VVFERESGIEFAGASPSHSQGAESYGNSGQAVNATEGTLNEMIFLKSHDGRGDQGHPLLRNTGGVPPGAGRLRTILEDRGNVMVILTISSVILSAAIGFRWLSPILHVAAVFPFFSAAMKRHKHHGSLALAVRWAAAVFVTTIVVGIFVPGRVGASVPFAQLTTAALANWVRFPDAPPPADYAYLLWGIVGFLLATLVSGGLLGFVLASVALGHAALGALFLFRYGENVIQITLVAVPLWQWGIIAAAIFMLVPTSLPFFQRYVRIKRVVEDRAVLRDFMYMGGALVIASLLLRVVTAGPWRTILREWTIF
jgi:hypothetical protein